MDFPSSLLSVLCASDARGNETAVDADVAGFVVAPLNDNVEAMFAMAPATDANATLDTDMCSTLETVAALLQTTILASTTLEDARLDTMTDEEAEIYTKETIDKVRATKSLETEDNTEMKNLAELLRADKNIQRWYLQFFLLAKGFVLPMPLRRLQSHYMMELYLLVIDTTAGDPDNTVRQQVARHACLSLFYSTYSPTGNDKKIQQAQAYLVEQLGFLESVMRLLQTNNTPEVLVALVRIVHNLLASLPGTVKRVEEISIPCDESTAPWASSLLTEATLQILLQNILMWYLQATPAFPGDATDRRSDLVLEMLRILYILRAGRSVTQDETLARLIVYFFKLPNTEERAYRCKLSAISLLMDAPAEYSERLVEQKNVLPLLAVLDRQVTQVVDLSQADSSAAAAVVPILTVLHKFCTHDEAFKIKVKNSIFPPECEEYFASLAAKQETKLKKNMLPLDCPEYTLRWKLVKLMTWPESHIKRTAAELLWTLCNQQEKEFIWRTGLGNALPLLSSKGLFELPTELSS